MLALRAAAAPTRPVARRRAVRAASAPEQASAPAPEQASPASGGETVFFAGAAVPSAEWDVSKQQQLEAAATAALVIPAPPPTFGEIMAFSGPAPEAMNVRASL